MSLILLILVAVLAFVVIAGVGVALVGSDAGGGGKATKRLAAVSGPATARGGRTRAAADAPGVRRKQIAQNLKALEKQGRATRLTLESRLRHAGLAMSVQRFWMMSAGLGLVTLVLALLVMRGMALAALLLSVVAALGLPRWVLSYLAAKRQRKFVEEFPSATDVIVRGIKSGLPVNDCLRVIAQEGAEPLGGEFRRVVEAVGMGQNLDQALERMNESMPTAEVRFFAIVLSIQQKTGGNLAEALNNLSVVLRARKLMKEKIKAMSGEAVASAFIIGSLPPGVMIMMYFTSPAYISMLFTDHRGHTMLLGGAIWMAIGIFTMKRMINFKI